MAGYRLIALAIAMLAGAIVMAAGATSNQFVMRDFVGVGAILMSVSGLWLLIDLVLSYTIKK